MVKNFPDKMRGFNENGFVIVKDAFDCDQLSRLEEAIRALVAQSHEAQPGLRRLLGTSPSILEFARSAGAELIKRVFGATAFPVRGILFDKSIDSNWYVTWHQDRTVPVTKRKDTEGFRAWSVKEGVHHVQPPSLILDPMISMRIHLDDCPEDNGAIRFVPGSHKFGIIPEQEIATTDNNARSVTVAACAGDVIFMRPLILHASSKATRPQNRRVVHIEYATEALPNGLEWGLA